MALSERHRSSIYTTLAPMLGEEETEALLSQFPARDLDQPVTKEFVRSEGLATRSELRAEMAAMRSDLREEIAELGTELRGEIAGVRSEMGSLETRLVGQFGAAMAAQVRWTVGTVLTASLFVTGVLGALISLT